MASTPAGNAGEAWSLNDRDLAPVGRLEKDVANLHGTRR